MTGRRGVCDRLLHGDRSNPLTLVVFDLLRECGETILRVADRERRERLEALRHALVA